MNWSEGEVLKVIEKKQYVNAIGVADPPPSPRQVRVELDRRLRICSDRSPRVVLVEYIDEYMVFITIPNGKSECDFRVWRYSPNLSPRVKIPTHDDLGKMFIELKEMHDLINEYLVNVVIKLLRDRWSIERIVQYYFNNLSNSLKDEVKKFLSTLKWIGLQEDVNYPPPRYLGSRMTLAIYVLLEAGFNLSEIRRVVRFRS